MSKLSLKVINKTRQVSDFCFKYFEYKNDKNFDYKMVYNGFSDHKEESKDDYEILNRICIAYIKAKEVQRNVSPIYSPSNEWLPIYEKPLKEIIEILTKRDIETLSRIYGNFWRDSCSTGLVGLPVNMEKCYFGKKISLRNKIYFLNDAYNRYRLWNSLLGDTHSIKDLESPCIGNPFGYYIDGNFIVSGSDYNHYYATIIGRLLKSAPSKCVVELGAGFGGMAYYLLRDNNDISYVDFDLPENAALTAYYLLKAFPEKKIRLYGEVDSITESLNNNEILIMPSFEIEKLPTGCVGLAFNSYSLAEMSKETVKSYISKFTEMVEEKGYIMHINHNKNSEFIADNFGIDPNQFDLLYKIPALWNMGRNSLMDEYEYLYRKSTNESTPKSGFL